MRLHIFTIALLVAFSPLIAQTNAYKPEFKFYGRIRADLIYNSRACNESVDGLFCLFPKNNLPDANGQDLNATPQGGMYTLYSRLGVDITGPKLGSANSSAKVEIDFRGNSTSYTMPRIRHAYFKLDWTKSTLLVGQTWHPMFGEVFPSMLNLSTGAPFQPFNRSPLIMFSQQLAPRFQLKASTIWQMQYTSVGPNGKSNTYLKNSCVPEIFLGADYTANRLRIGAGAELLKLKPRTQTTINAATYKVNERVTSLSAEAHAKYTAPNWTLSAKTTLANNLTQASTLGGYGVTHYNPDTHQSTYTPFRHSASWINFVYGKKWKPGVFLGYMKNLGTSKPITGEVYGTGLDIDQLLGANLQLTYNLPHFTVGAEISSTTAWYGNIYPRNGKVTDTHSVANYRMVATAIYMF